ncbi:MAG: hypothetical protein K6A45_08060 [Lachnospiraceae bacterium]|nr:hypothetical protein [Lachnospiraceae bacterium]
MANLNDIKILIIYNPKAGKGRIKQSIPEIKSMFNDAGLAPDFYATKCSGDATTAAKKYLKRFCNFKYGYYGDREKIEGLTRKHNIYVVAAGGDGTLNEVMSGVLASGYKVPIGIIPTGSTNDFGYSLKLEGDPTELARIVLNAILNDTAFECDVATFNTGKPDENITGQPGKYITYTAAFGLFSDVSYATPQNLKNTFGHLAYIMYGAKNLFKTKKIHARISYTGTDKILRSAQDDNDIILNEVKNPDTDNNTVPFIIDTDLLLGMIVSAKSVGGFRGITGSDVALDDGEHELLFVKWPAGPLKLIKTIGHAIGMVLKRPDALEKAKDLSVDYGIKIIKVKEATFEFDNPVSWSLDGEDGGEHTEATITVENKAVSYLAG